MSVLFEVNRTYLAQVYVGVWVGVSLLSVGVTPLGRVGLWSGDDVYSVGLHVVLVQSKSSVESPVTTRGFQSSTMSLYRNSAWFLKGLTEFTR